MYNFNKEAKVRIALFNKNAAYVEKAGYEERFLFRELPTQLCEDRVNE